LGTAIGYEDGKSQPRRITNWAETGVGDFGATSDEKHLAVMKAVTQSHVVVGDLEAAGRGLKSPRHLTLEESLDVPWQWTPDSKAVLFWSDRNGTNGIYKQGSDQTTAQPIVTGPDDKDCGAPSPDGSWILYLSLVTAELAGGANQFGPAGPLAPARIMRVRASGGAPQLVLEGRGISSPSCARSPATLCVSLFPPFMPDLERKTGIAEGEAREHLFGPALLANLGASAVLSLLR